VSPIEYYPDYDNLGPGPYKCTVGYGGEYQWGVSTLQAWQEVINYSNTNSFWEYVGVECSNSNDYFTGWESSNYGWTIDEDLTMECPRGTTLTWGYGEIWLTNSANPPYTPVY
jgi:hypothetical protein